MLLGSPPPTPPHYTLSSSLFAYSQISLGFCSPVLFARKEKERRLFVPIRCASISQIHNYETVYFERIPRLKWCSFFRHIATTENGGPRSGALLDRWEEEQQCLFKWELCHVAKELRNFCHFRLTLDKDTIAMDEGSKMEEKMAMTRISCCRTSGRR